ncbi:SHOCT domain-containing protein [Streptomycetaceae bacterium NBC_01309]
MPGLIRGVARTAVVAGTATAVSNRVSRRQQGRWAQQSNAQPAQPQYAEAAPPQPSPPADDTNTKLAQLKELGALRDQGVLTDAEFEAQKARILAS